jgi:hypothetical protein
MKQLVAVAALLIATITAGLADAPLAPSALIAGSSTYDGQDVTVAGTIKNVQTKDGPRGTMTQYQLCDTQCVNVIQFGSATVTQGQTQTVTGRFRASVDRGPVKAQDVIMIAPAGGWHHPHQRD